MNVALIVSSRRRTSAIARARRLPVWDGSRVIAGRHLDPILVRPIGNGEVRIEWPFQPEES